MMTNRTIMMMGLTGMALAATLVDAAAADAVQYAHDNGVVGTNVGPPSSFPVDPETLWGNYFMAVEGGEVITSISAAFGPTFPKDREVTVALFDDPDDDGDPRNAVFMTSTTGLPDELGGGVFTEFAIEPTEISGGFFVAVFAYTEKGVDRPAAMDSSGVTQHSWLVYNPASVGVNLDDLGANAMALPIDEVPGFFTGAWMVRATGIGSEPQVPGDFNGDGVVDVADLLILLSAWGPCGGSCPADLNEDGQVDVSDLLELLGNWG